MKPTHPGPAPAKSPARGRCWVVCVAGLSSLGAFLFGLDIGYIGPILECPSFKRDVAHMDDWQDPRAKISSGAVGFIVGVFSIGCIIMSFPPISSYFLDRWGRKSSIMLGSGVFIVGCLIQARASSVAQICLGRLVAGCSVGLLSTVVALYQSEVAPPAIRGGLTSLYQFMITCGILVAAALDVPLVNMENGWRVAIYFQLLPATLLLCGMALLPRSPRWLVQQGRGEEALRVLRSIREESEAQREFQEIVAGFEAARASGDVRWRELCSGRLGRLLIVGVSMQLLQQLVGMNAFMYFGPRLFQSLGLSENKFQTLNNAVNCAATLPALHLADRCGRRSLLAWGAAGMAVSCLIMGTLGQLCMSRVDGQWVASSGTVTAAIVAMVFSFVINFAYGWGPIVWVYCAEIFPLKYRSRCVGVTTMSNWVGNFLIAQFTPVLLESCGFGTFWIFGFFSLLALALALWIPETRGVSLENIDRLFDVKFGTATADLDGSVPQLLVEDAATQSAPDPSVVGLGLTRRCKQEEEEEDSGLIA